MLSWAITDTRVQFALISIAKNVDLLMQPKCDVFRYNYDHEYHFTLSQVQYPNAISSSLIKKTITNNLHAKFR